MHVDDLADLFCLAAELAPHEAILHGVADDVRLHDLARAINRMIGTDEHTDSRSLLQMLGITADTVGNISGSFTPPPSAPSGISMSLNKRLCSDSTRKLLDWSPQRADIWDDVAFGSYAGPSPPYRASSSSCASATWMIGTSPWLTEAPRAATRTLPARGSTDAMTRVLR